MMNRIQVVHMINQLGRGGTERQLCLLLRHSDRQRFAHRVVVFNPSRHAPWNRELEAAGVRVLEVPADCRGVVQRLAHLWWRLRRRRPDVLHSWTVHDNPYAGLLGFVLRTPVRWGSLRGTFHSAGIRRLPAIYRVLMLRSVHRLTVNCEALEDELLDGGYPAKRVLVLPNCVLPGSTGGGAADVEAWASEGPLVAVVANLRQLKNPLMFVRAMGQVLPRHPGARALIVGQPMPSEPEMPDKIAAEIRRLDLEGRVIVTGFRRDVSAILQRLTVFCLTSNVEGMPNAILEAMAAGLPVVATRVGGVPELVSEGWNGYIVETDDAGALADRVNRLLSDPALASELGENGRRQATGEHGCRQAAERLEELYVKALRRAKR